MTSIKYEDSMKENLDQTFMEDVANTRDVHEMVEFITEWMKG